MNVTSHISSSIAETERVAAAFAATLSAGDVVMLHGALGAGKTAFARGMAHGLGIDADDVSSPTFTLVHEYRGGRMPLYHADLYRLESAAVEDLGLEEMGAGVGILAIEWAERLRQPMSGAISVTLYAVDEQTRRIEISR